MNITNGIIQDSSIGGVPLVRMIVEPKGSRNVRTLKPLATPDGKPKYIAVHNTGNPAASANARAHYSWLQGVEANDSSYVSVHLFVDEDEVVQTCPLTEMTYHAGDGSTGKGNAQSISIEICENHNYQKAEENAIKVIRALMEQYGIPLGNVQPHRYFAPNKKLCPHLILKSEASWKENWAAFQSRIHAVNGAGASDVDVIAKEVIAGKWGNGAERRQRLAAAGYDYAQVQARVNALLGGSSSPAPIQVGDTVRITCNNYSTGQSIPAWVKAQPHKVSQIKDGKALLGYPVGISSWVPLSGIVRA